jgi:hypothetical protein
MSLNNHYYQYQKFSNFKKKMSKKGRRSKKGRQKPLSTSSEIENNHNGDNFLATATTTTRSTPSISGWIVSDAARQRGASTEKASVNTRKTMSPFHSVTRLSSKFDSETHVDNDSL